MATVAQGHPPLGISDQRPGALEQRAAAKPPGQLAYRARSISLHFGSSAAQQSRGLAHRAKLDSNEELARFADLLEKVDLVV